MFTADISSISPEFSSDRSLAENSKVEVDTDVFYDALESLSPITTPGTLSVKRGRRTGIPIATKRSDKSPKALLN
ncbi:unnamed protein product [Auanema sp. JU1783]|nr:unnamed protein product [Auanema sp. JU1783]